jgi:hypothetical protein
LVSGAAEPRLADLMQPCSKCTDPAGAVMAFSYPDRVAWLRGMDAGIDPFTEHPLCLRHADRFVAPVGWRLDDRRGRPALPRPTADVA